MSTEEKLMTTVSFGEVGFLVYGYATSELAQPIVREIASESAKQVIKSKTKNAAENQVKKQTKELVEETTEKQVKEVIAKSGTGTWDVLPTNMKFDQGAHDLAEEIGGVAQARFRNDSREFDAISDQFIGQHKPALGDNFGGSFKKQTRATFEAAKSTGREVYYKFDGKPGQRVIDKLNQYSSEYGVKVTIKY